MHNTYGERHCYLLRPDADGHAGADKAFYVSPFFAVDGRYEMSSPTPAGSELRVAISLAAARRRPCSGRRWRGTPDAERAVVRSPARSAIPPLAGGSSP